MVSIKDVAKLSGVSVTTVSRVLNNRGYIGKETRLKVEDAMKQLDYQPNQIARALLKSQSHVIGVIVPDLSHPLFSELIHWIETYASEKNYKLLLCSSLQDKEKELNYISMLRQNRVDGIIMCSHTLEVEAYRNVGMPIVSFDRILSPEIPYVAGDNYRGGELATQHLINKGCKKILHISGPLQYELLANRRNDASQLTCMKQGVSWDYMEGAHVKATFQDNWAFIEEKISAMLTEYDGVFCSNDIMAYALYTYANEHGINVPEQLKIIGYDNHSFTRMLQHPRLTTIKQPIDAIGKNLCSSLIDQIEQEGKEIPRNTVLDVRLVEGETT
ncbi:LacI family DNA-binding transcriptional regulator [Halobacillus andaensis]|uniref:LacI family DNA-binding transcriptional regulator n=1 Tax=Halobacillus andaensis TaxID=1176239 RepID=UPI003D7548BC